MMPSEFDWREGQVTFWDLCEIDDNVSLESQIEKLKEDMAQARFGECTERGWWSHVSLASLTRPDCVSESAYQSRPSLSGGLAHVGSGVSRRRYSCALLSRPGLTDR